MRRVASAFVCSLFVALLVPSAVDAGPTFAASFELGGAPSWQSASQRAEMGSWVKHSSPVVADLGDGPAVLVGSLDGKLYALRYRNGSLTKLWDSGDAIGTFIDSSPAVADLNGDGCPEVVVGAGNEYRPHASGVHVFDCHGRNHRFWPAPMGGGKPNHVGVFSTPAIGDVNGDGSPDVAYGSFNQKIYVKDRNGNDLPGWPLENYDTVWSSPALADVNGDGRREVIIGTDRGGGASATGCPKGTRGTLWISRADGSFLSGFPRCLDTPIWSSPAVQDLNGDGTLDVVVGSNNYIENGAVVGDPRKVRAWDTRSANLLWETTVTDGSRLFSSPAVGDVGGDGGLDVAVGTLPSGNYGEVFLLDARTGTVRWRREGGHHQVCACMFMGSPVIADVDGDGKAEVVAASQDGGISAWDEVGGVVIGDLHAPPRPGAPSWQNESYMFFNSPAVADLDGDGRNEIVMASAISGSSPLRGKVWIVSTAGRGAGPWPLFKRSADRQSSVGSGGAGAPPPPAPPPAAPASRRPAPARTTSPTSTPLETPQATGEPTMRPQAVDEPQRSSSRMPLVLAALAAAGGAVGVLALKLRRRRRA